MKDGPSDPAQLDERFGIKDALGFTRGDGGLTRIEIDSGGSLAEIYLHGAHVTKFVPSGHEPVLWMSRKSRFSHGTPIRGGIPICFPWFGAHPADSDLPNHGFLRLSEWEVVSTETKGDEAAISLKSQSNKNSQQMWPYSFEAILEVVVGNRLSLTLGIANSGDREFDFTEALHSYFAVSDIRFIDLLGLDATEYFDKLAGGHIAVQRGELRFTSETDRPYLDTSATCTIVDPGKSRSIVVEKRGSSTTVVWNPWIAKARRMEDFGDDEWQGMICVETANALKNSVSLGPGESHSISTTISVNELERGSETPG